MLNVRKKDNFAIRLTILAILALIFNSGNFFRLKNSNSDSDISIGLVAAKDTSSSHIQLTSQASRKIQSGSIQSLGKNNRALASFVFVKPTIAWNTLNQVDHVSRNYQSRCFTSKSQIGTSFVYQGQSPPIS